MTRYDILSTPF